MAYREVTRVEIEEVVRRWQAGEGLRRIASGTGISRITVRKYVAAAEEMGLFPGGASPEEEQLSRLAGISQAGPRQVQIPSEEILAPWEDQIYQWITQDKLQFRRIQELLAQRSCRISYSALYRWLQRRNWRRRSLRTVRMEQSAPGEVAELDFGRLGFIQDQETGRRQAVWALLVVLTYSRHSLVWPAYGQKLEDVIAGLEAAWEFFGGIPKYLVIDNFPAAVAGADALHPRLTRGFLEYSQHRGFITDPARVRHPKDKPIVERSVQYARERFFKGGDFKDLNHLRNEAPAGVVTSPDNESTAPPGVSPCRSSWTRSARPCPLGRRALRSHPLAHRQGPPRSPRGLPIRSLLGAIVPVPARTAGGGRPGPEAGAHLPPGPADQDPLPPAPGRPVHRHCRLPRRAERLHAAGARRHQAQRRGTGPRSGRVRRAPL